jgi:hypothetical protein
MRTRSTITTHVSVLFVPCGTYRWLVIVVPAALEAEQTLATEQLVEQEYRFSPTAVDYIERTSGIEEIWRSHAPPGCHLWLDLPANPTNATTRDLCTKLRKQLTQTCMVSTFWLGHSTSPSAVVVDQLLPASVTGPKEVPAATTA